jgi:hypothetical protein
LAPQPVLTAPVEREAALRLPGGRQQCATRHEANPYPGRHRVQTCRIVPVQEPYKGCPDPCPSAAGVGRAKRALIETSRRHRPGLCASPSGTCAGGGRAKSLPRRSLAYPRRAKTQGSIWRLMCLISRRPRGTRVEVKAWKPRASVTVRRLRRRINAEAETVCRLIRVETHRRLDGRRTLRRDNPMSAAGAK